jgi:sugar/nucleoside kinase (ribokinase family)
VEEVIASPLRPREREALAAFLAGWAKEWPRAFAGAFGNRVERVAAWVTSSVGDEDRYLKLRRIAIENLTEVL